MNTAKKLPTHKFLRECFVYNRSTGELRWKARPQKHFPVARIGSTWNTRFSGELAGSLNNRGYYKVDLAGTYFLAHRVIWKLVTGKEPPEFLDHIDGVRSNNRWANLRVATRTEQNRNSKFRSHNTSGNRGVCWSRGKWQANIRIDGVLWHLGYFVNREDAAAIYEAAARKAHGKFYRGPDT